MRERLRELLGLVRDKIAVEPGALNLYLTRDWQAIPAHDSFGHDVETAYLLVEAAEALGHSRRRQDLAHGPHAWSITPSTGAGTTSTAASTTRARSFGGAAFDRTKVWWTQAEGLNALLADAPEVRRARPTATAKAFLKQWDFIEEHLIDPVHGGWYAETTREGKLIGDGAKATQWKANYHTSRALMNVARMLGELAGEWRVSPAVLGCPALPVQEKYHPPLTLIVWPVR